MIKMFLWKRKSMILKNRKKITSATITRKNRLICSLDKTTNNSSTTKCIESKTLNLQSIPLSFYNSM